MDYVNPAVLSNDGVLEIKKIKKNMITVQTPSTDKDHGNQIPTDQKQVLKGNIVYSTKKTFKGLA